MGKRVTLSLATACWSLFVGGAWGQGNPYNSGVRSAPPPPVPQGSGSQGLPRRSTLDFQVAPVPEAKAKPLHAEIVARVDNRVILLADVIQPYQAKLEEARKKLPEQQYLELEWRTLEQATKRRIERLALMLDFEESLPKPEVMDRIRLAARRDFERHLKRMAREGGYESPSDLVAQVVAEGGDLAGLEREYIDNMIAMQYVAQQVGDETPEPSRRDLLLYYDEHRNDFAEPAGAVWRHIEIRDFGQESRTKAEQAAQRLAAGEDFAKVAKEMSQGPTASAGGLWTRISPGSYRHKEVDEVIFSIPVGQISPIITAGNSFHIVRVEERSDGNPKPFSEVQDKIRDAIRNEARAKLRERKVQEIVARHHVESIFDGTLNIAPQAAAANNPTFRR